MVGFPLHSQDRLCWVGSLGSCFFDCRHCLACLTGGSRLRRLGNELVNTSGVLYFFYTFDHPELSQGMIEAR